MNNQCHLTDKHDKQSKRRVEEKLIVPKVEEDEYLKKVISQQKSAKNLGRE